MKTKSLSVFGIASLMLFLCMTLVSAASNFSISPSTITFTPSVDSNTITITNTNTSTPLSVTLTLPTIDGNSFNYSGNISEINSSVITITPTSAINFSDMGFGESLSGIMNVFDGSETENITIKIENDRFCEYNNPGSLSVKITDINNKGIGEEDEWYPLDILEVEVEVKNKGSQDISDIILEWGVYDSDGNWIINPIEEDDFDVDEDDKEIITFTIDLDDDLDIDLEELKDGSYDLYVRATGERDDSNDYTCASASDSIDIIVDKDYVVLKDIELVGTPFCGSALQLKTEVINIGSKDQEDITVSISNTELGINEELIIKSLDALDSKKLVFDFSLPSDLVEKTYNIALKVFDEDDDLYENSNDDLSSYLFPIAVSGNCIITPKASVYASLESGGKAGEQMVVRASVTNTDSKSKTYTIKTADYSGWAELVSIEPANLTLAAGQVADVLITLNLSDDAPETTTFSIIVEDEQGNKITQPVSASIEQPKSSFSDLFGEKGYIWGIIALNIILIILIIIIAVKVARK